MCPGAIFDDYFLKNPTNNAVFIKYRTQNQNKFNAYIRFRCYYNIQPPVCSYIYINYYIHIYIIIPFIQLYMSLYASVARRFWNPRAIYNDYTIYNPTNNSVPIQYLAQNQNNFYAYIRFRCYDNIQPPMCLHNIETPPPTPSPISLKAFRKFPNFKPSSQSFARDSR